MVSIVYYYLKTDIEIAKKKHVFNRSSSSPSYPNLIYDNDIQSDKYDSLEVFLSTNKLMLSLTICRYIPLTILWIKGMSEGIIILTDSLGRGA